MEKTKVLYVTQEMKPYLELTDIAEKARELPQFAQDAGMEIRVLMPRFGIINERRHRLHEVVRLSGINIIIDDDDYPLIIKVASLPGARIQVYFLDNEDFFKRKSVFGDKKEDFYDDNAERMIFFCKGVLETVKKFGWSPDIVHCHGWFTSLVPLYLKTAYKNEPVFSESKVVYSVYDQHEDFKLAENFVTKATQINKNIENKAMGLYDEGTFAGLEKGAMANSDAVILGNDNLNGEVRQFVEAIKKPVLKLENSENYWETYKEFYLSLLEEK